MNIFILDADSERFLDLTVVKSDDWDKFLDGFEGEPMAASWRPVQMKVLRKTKSDWDRKLGDFSPLTGGNAAFSERAVNVLGRVLTDNGELLPLKCDEGSFFVYNVTRFVDALDNANTECNRFDDGKIFRFIRPEFYKKKLGKFPVFKVPQSPRGDVFVTDEFTQRVMDGGLVGFKFRKMWSDEKKPARWR